jgi:hypothetical protein
MLGKCRSEKGRDQRAGFAERQIDRVETWLDAFEQRGEARKRGGDEIVELAETGRYCHEEGLGDGVASGNGSTK